MTAEAWKRGCMAVAGASGAMAVGFGAYAAHGPVAATQAGKLVDLASHYQLIHALALLAVAQLWQPGRRFVMLAGLLFTVGIVLFCGGLYSSALGSLSVGMLVPFGGTSFLLGWLSLVIAALAQWGRRGI